MVKSHIYLVFLSEMNNIPYVYVKITCQLNCLKRKYSTAQHCDLVKYLNLYIYMAVHQHLQLTLLLWIHLNLVSFFQYTLLTTPFTSIIISPVRPLQYSWVTYDSSTYQCMTDRKYMDRLILSLTLLSNISAPYAIYPNNFHWFHSPFSL